MTVDEWLVVWRLAGRPDTLPRDMLLSIPRAAFEEARRVNPYPPLDVATGIQQLAEFRDTEQWLSIEWLREWRDPKHPDTYYQASYITPSMNRWQNVGSGDLRRVRAFLKRTAEKLGLL